ncbi:MAG: DUF4290 domain-containing protein [Bacteroidetes bacterium]|nr:DUF4290 domain-containing protein [Bacteroidota bacterium]MBS1630460.1 DUF4290 domain-containing protein [Bacteroidota bacterium]
MEYNTTREALEMPEYGRTVQSMAEYLLTIEDRSLRLKNAEAVIDVMSILNPQLKQQENYRHKLWDHLHQMTGFKLDVDGPFEKPNPEELHKKPSPLPYPARPVKNKHLGTTIEQLIEKAKAESDPEKKASFTQHIAYFMKLAYANWHKEPVHDDMIRAELAQISGGALNYEPDGGFYVHVDLRQPQNFKKKKNRGNYQQSNYQQGNFNKKRKYKKNKGGM